MNILGISAYYHDSAACLMQDGEVVAAAQEERFSRKKQDEGYPKLAVEYCLQEGGITYKDLDYVAFYDKPFVKFERLLTTYLATFPRGIRSYLKAMPVWLKDKLWVRTHIRDELPGFGGEILFGEHHQSHAASSFLMSPFEEAAICTADGVGEWTTTSLGYGQGTKFELTREIRFPHSIGLLYSALTYYLGFKVNSAEYKVMGLAPYGEPKYAQKMMDEIIEIKDDGSFHLNMKVFDFATGLRMTNAKFDKVFGQPPRAGDEAELTQFHKDMAASVQLVTEEVMLRIARTLHKQTGSKNLCLAGGVALNCVANGRIIRETEFENIYVQPAAGDAGGAIGAAAYVWHSLLGNPRNGGMKSVYLGPKYPDEEIETYLKELGVPYKKYSPEEMVKETAKLIADQAVVGWMQGRMEFGPRALGGRSILADPRNEENWQRVNLKIKFRESFRPFAPVVLAEKAEDWFDLRGKDSPYMLLVAQVHENKRTIPAVTHVDGSARIQTVTREQHPEYYDIIKAFDELTGCPVLINTSFNVRGEPIVCTPQDSFRCFMRTHMDALVMGSFILRKEEMPEQIEGEDWNQQFERD
ncbi:MAG: carbamoyltransferase [Chrysiogenetes bacterium]|nr:carbamoyltransferase [Chrysiogenetes bacterium]